MEVLQNEQKTEVLYGSHTKLTEVDGGYMTIVPVHASVSDTNAGYGYWGNGIPVPRVLWHGSANLGEVLGTGTYVTQTSQTFRVRVL